jgi:hypothetical protein
MGVEFKDIRILDFTGNDKIGFNLQHQWNFKFDENDLFLIVISGLGGLV